MGDYLNSSLFQLDMWFYNQNKQGSFPHISRKKSGVSNPFALPDMHNGRTINLRKTIENTVRRSGVKKLELTDEQYDTLEKVEIYYQELSVSGRGSLFHCHWSVLEGFRICEILLDPEYVCDKAVYQSPDWLNGEALSTSKQMLKENLSSCQTEKAKGKCYVLLAEDYPLEDTKARYNTYWMQVKQEWTEKFGAYFATFVGADFNKKSVVLATDLSFYGEGRLKIVEELKERGAIVKERVNKKTDFLLVDTRHIEKMDCFAERLWREREGDMKTVAKISKQSIELAINYNASGSNICIVNLQEYLAFYGMDYDELIMG